MSSAVVRMYLQGGVQVYNVTHDSSNNMGPVSQLATAQGREHHAIVARTFGA